MKRAFTLVELLIAMVLTLILITAIAQFYAIVGDSVKDGRAIIEMGGRMRAAQVQLASDLDNATSPAQPWVDDSHANGYFEYFEGIACDYNANGNFNAGLPVPDSSTLEDSNGNGVNDLLDLAVTNMIGDGDDFIAFTIRSLERPLNGRLRNPTTGETAITTSNLAEVIWWVGFDDLDNDQTWDFNEPRNLYRRQLLIRPDVTGIDGTTNYPDKAAAQARLRTLLQLNDISLSARAVLNQMGQVVYRIDTNSIADLTRREHRFPHDQANLSRPANSPWLVANFPFRQILLPSLSAKTAGVTEQTSLVLQGDYTGEDVVLNNVLAFDVQIYDPYVRLWPDDPTQINASMTALAPSDPGYGQASVVTRPIIPPPLLGLGAYVDLGYYRNLPTTVQNENNTAAITLPYFARLPAIPPSLPVGQQANYLNQIGFTFDTWPLAYERDGMFQLASWGVPVARMDLQSNGLDDLDPTGNYVNGVDDAGERETNAPYQNAARGIQVKLRLYEPSTRQVRQVTVANDFVTE